MTHQNKPHFGGRSKKNFGLNLQMDAAFFHDTSSEGRANRTKNPVPSAFRKHENEAFELRSKLFKSHALSEHTTKERMDEWVNIMREVRSNSTDAFVRIFGPVEDFVPFTKEAIDAVSQTALDAIIHLRGLVSRRIEGKWSAAVANKPTPSLNLTINNAAVIYVVRDREQDGRHHCKIGFTTDLDQRLDSFRTVVPDIELITTLICSGTLTEPAVQKLFAAKRHDREWFWLDQSDLSLLMNPERVRQMISEAA